MREIKFKAYDHLNKCWVPIVYIGPNGEIFFGVFRQGDGKQEFLGTISNEHNSIVQYKGLKDKNGKEIYEGDVLLMNNQ